MSDFVSRGFSGRRRTPEEDAARLPPGQYAERGFPVLTAGPTPGSSPAVAVSGLGDKAAYINNSGSVQLLRALVGNYLVDVRAESITPDVTESQLHPLVAKAIAGL